MSPTLVWRRVRVFLSLLSLDLRGEFEVDLKAPECCISLDHTFFFVYNYALHLLT